MSQREYTAEEIQRRKDLITDQAHHRYGLTIDGWATDEYGDVQAFIGRWTVVEDKEDEGLYEGEEGELYASVVGAREHSNERVAFSFKGDDFEEIGGEAEPFVDIEPIGG